MYLYNVTVNLEDSIHDEWMDWMTQKHLAEVMATGCFVAHRILKVLTEVENNGTTYSVQYYFNSMTDFERYQDKYAPALRQEGLKMFGEKMLAFRTLLEIVV
jgi:hypothetical protein